MFQDTSVSTYFGKVKNQIIKEMCAGYFSVTVIKYHDQKQPGKGFILVYGSGGGDKGKMTGGHGQR